MQRLLSVGPALELAVSALLRSLSPEYGAGGSDRCRGTADVAGVGTGHESAGTSPVTAVPCSELTHPTHCCRSATGEADAQRASSKARGWLVGVATL